MGEPMIRIKKADGTTERVPLSSVTNNNKQITINNKHVTTNDYQTTTPPSPTTNDQPITIDSTLEPTSHKQSDPSTSEPRTLNSEPEKKQTFLIPSSQTEEVLEQNDLPMVETPHELSTTTPVHDYFTDLAKAHEWNERDHRSPLEEMVTPEDIRHLTDHTIPSSHLDDVHDIVQTLSFPLSAELYSRLHALIQSRIKDIRTDAQIIEYALRGDEAGGLGLTEAQAEELVSAIHKTLAVSHQRDIPAPAVSSSQDVLPSVGTKNGPSSFTDIHPPEKVHQTVGPIEEIGELTLLDFRRYHTDPAKAVDVLQKKVNTVRDESYLEYQKIKHAWHQSPLYRGYLAQIASSLRANIPLTDAPDGELTPEDIKEIAGFSAGLRM